MLFSPLFFQPPPRHMVTARLPGAAGREWAFYVPAKSLHNNHRTAFRVERGVNW